MSAPRNAQQHEGVWLPNSERHLLDIMSPDNKRFARLPDGRAAFQRHKYRALVEHIPRDRRRRFVDIGGYVGLWAMQAELDFAAVDSFEPVAAFRSLYWTNVRTDRCRLHATALGDRDGQVGMTVPRAHTASSHVSGEGAIKMTTLDAMELDQVDAIKIDVEGFELPVVKGAQRTILQHRPWMIVEQKGNEVGNFGGDRDAAVAFLRTLGMVPLRAPMAGDWIMGWP